MSGAVSHDVTQRDLLGAAATAYRAAEWLVVSLHLDRANPRQRSGPDLLCVRDGRGVAVKVSLSGSLTAAQEKVRAEYDAIEGITYVVYSTKDLMKMVSDAE